VCGGDFIFVERKVQDGKKIYNYFETRCQNKSCRAKLAYGVSMEEEGVIYPKRKWQQLSESEQKQRIDEKEYADKNYGYLKNQGWFQYKPEKQKQEPSGQQNVGNIKEETKEGTPF
jgi:hypothetical protein